MMQPVRLAYQPPANSTFLSEQTSHQQPASSTLLSQQTSISHQPTEQAHAHSTSKLFRSSNEHMLLDTASFSANGCILLRDGFLPLLLEDDSFW
jgi:hypothetical protein